jgi:nitrogen regulatory protein P-II 1
LGEPQNVKPRNFKTPKLRNARTSELSLFYEERYLAMKEIKAIIQPFRLSAVVAALQQIPDLPGITVFDVRGFGRHSAGIGRDTLEDEDILYAKRIQLELVVQERLVEDVIRAIQQSAHTGNPGDGKIFASSLDDAIRIRSGERGEAAL